MKGPVAGTKSAPAQVAPVERNQRVLAPDALLAVQRLAPDMVEETVDLDLQPRHLLPHVEDHLDAGQVDPEVPGEGEDRLQALDRLLVVEPCVALAARGLEQALPLVQAQRLRVDAVALGYHADQHVTLVALAAGHGYRMTGSPAPGWGAGRSSLLLVHVHVLGVDDPVLGAARGRRL